ncbi:MAG: hypothetical protein JNK49_13695 [Planctomycetes bacterium]|nr:hypothetical protein [Planctomycetota bacterium]
MLHRVILKLFLGLLVVASIAAVPTRVEVVKSQSLVQSLPFAQQLLDVSKGRWQAEGGVTLTAAAPAEGSCAAGGACAIAPQGSGEREPLEPTMGGATTCPAEHTKCPVQVTACPTVATHCPQHATVCVTTQCPAAATACPEVATTCQVTTCPAIQTSCPTTPTVCPAIFTMCPQWTTRCPTSPTSCPVATTSCPVERTKCPVDPTVCEFTVCPMLPTTCEATKCPYRHTHCPGGDWCRTRCGDSYLVGAPVGYLVPESVVRDVATALRVAVPRLSFVPE